VSIACIGTVKLTVGAFITIEPLSPACAGDGTETINAAVDAILAGFPCRSKATT